MQIAVPPLKFKDVPNTDPSTCSRLHCHNPRMSGSEFCKECDQEHKAMLAQFELNLKQWREDPIPVIPRVGCRSKNGRRKCSGGF